MYSLNSRIKQLYACSCDKCGGKLFHQSINLETESNFQKAIDNAFNHLYKNKSYSISNLVDEPYRNLIKETNTLIMNSVNKGLADNIIPKVMLESLRNDVFIFSGLKSHVQLFEASGMLLNEKGNIRNAYEFEQAVKTIKENYNTHYLDAERLFAQQSAQQAANWISSEENVNRYNLQYRTALDEKVRASHQVLEGITLPKNDAFWNEYYPPNGWRCRCVAIEVNKTKYQESNSGESIKKGEEATTQIGKNGKNKLAIFRFNPGKQKVIMPPNHPYFKVSGAKKVKDLIINEQLSFTEIYSNGKGSVEIHELVDQQANDFNRVLTIAKDFANKGKLVQILPKFNSTENSERYQVLYSDLKKTKYWGKCPDLRIDGVFFEHEGFTSDNAKRALKNMLNRGLKQSSFLIIEDCGINENFIVRNIKNRIFLEKQKIDEVYILKGTKIKRIY